MRAARLGALFLTALSVLLLTGCFGSRETDETAYVLAMGFDKGEKDNMVVTVSIANTKVIAGMAGGAGGAKEEGRNVLVQSVETYGPLAGLEQLSSVTGRHLSLLHTKAYIFSEELAKEGLADWVSTMSRYYELRATSYVFVCRGKAKDFLEKNQPPLELSPTKQYELIGSLSRAHGFYKNAMFLNFHQDVKSWSAEPSLPLVAIHEGGLETAKPGLKKGGGYEPGRYFAGELPVSGANKAQIMGTAVFRGSKMVGAISGEETRYYLMLRGEFENGFFSFVDPVLHEPALIGFTVHQARSPKYVTSINEDGTVTIDVDIYLEADLSAMLKGINYENPDLKPVIEEAFSMYVQQGCQNLIKRTQEEYKADIFNFGYRLKRHFWTVQTWHDFNWLERYPEAQVSVTVHTRVRRTGLMLKTSPSKED
ncbi:Ger(x)C family spore germination protein [Pelotomaculum isophthalicicum JI]|uniref:Ger(X)C family spore germination protein n=1 Tax=Pelotomaculum isophthalicicum JI TaxID=947010 RepID=A0A9X4H4Z7_9FIRM|nr:Ger(x)C family spore germination protein [Pelotomaculum isophthalicicum]MDF9409198.1 Ger(x)C family spore germination protein [Pelotomaculum isophthalicicum JI]